MTDAGPADASSYRRFRAGPALSTGRRDRLAAELAEALPGCTDCHAELEYFVELAGAPGEGEARRLAEVLGAEPAGPTSAATAKEVLVVPRPGTISPWSSKATDIVHRCGLDRVLRVERGVRYTLAGVDPGAELGAVAEARLHDRMTEAVLEAEPFPEALFRHAEPAPLRRIPLHRNGREALAAADAELGLALSTEELDYLADSFARLGRDPTDVELMMFAQANSEHCRHKTFRADWIVDGEAQPRTLFDMIRASYAASPDGVLSAYADNSAVIEGGRAARLFAGQQSGVYALQREHAAIMMKVETHNHPTAVSPFPGAATGAGGEIRDEGATGRGAKSKAGLTGFTVSNLRIPGFEQPWERDHGRPGRLASALSIMLDGPIGAAAFNNEFGRPNLAGYFRSFELAVPEDGGTALRGYHKPIMIAGGYGNIRAEHIDKGGVRPGDRVVVLGGPAMLIGLGGGAASSVASGASTEALDFASVQRGNPEMQRRTQEVIDRCWALGEDNPVTSIHDVGAGGLSNAVPEILDADGRGGRMEIREIPSAEPGMSPLEIWCNEAQERYVLVVAPERVERFMAICARERCPAAVIGEAAERADLVVEDRHFGERPVDMPMSVLLGRTPKMTREAAHRAAVEGPLPLGVDPTDAAERLLRLPAVADKTFLITIGDRTVGGLSCRDQMVGPWQVPVSDVAVTAAGFDGVAGEAMAMGERPPAALADPAASGRIAVGEAITNIAAAAIGRLADVRLSANWMAAAGELGEDAALYDTVRAVGEELCPALGVAIPVGKDSLSMRTVWEENGEQRSMTAPLSLIVSAFAPVEDVSATLTPELRLDRGPTELVLIDLGRRRNRLGGSCLAQVYECVGGPPPDVDAPDELRVLFETVQRLRAEGRLLAYHDRSDGGLFVTLCEMAFAAHCGLRAELDALGDDTVAALFGEELGAVVQVAADDAEDVVAAFEAAGLAGCVHRIGAPTRDDRISFRQGDREVLGADRIDWQRAWSETSFHMRALRDDPECAREEHDVLLDRDDPGLSPELTFDPRQDPAAPYIAAGARPRVAVLREQGVNGQIEMAAAFDRAGFEAVDVHMSDLFEGRTSLSDCTGLVAPGGFSFGDVLGAGEGWARSILFSAGVRDELAAFFERQDSFALGVCNGCQMLSALAELIPGAASWPRFERNRSERFEGRLSQVHVEACPSLFLAGMAGSRLPIAIAHGEGRAVFDREEDGKQLAADRGIVLRYADGRGRTATRYPDNPNGSPGGIAGVTTRDGRVTLMMPHPERLVRTVQHSWHPGDWGADGPWLRMFRNARAWLG